ncbi:PepSY domain-containing protein [Aquincola sp. J276]|uniref:PepSY-associated TM helix domain-containing protein n=1 Tax=Aquincola sp. J276 TaxID=2898432 RepID=UPI0021513B6D|nr:PepSY domain-containing protein [Aquincola sp. J276]MCR5866254.1 PepSY domain-containing protein [Aquincola sp. J276]
MLSTRAIRGWQAVHTWSSLVCTVFMLLLCLTGLPLIFHHEIGHLLGTEIEAAEMPADAPRASLDEVMALAGQRYPGKQGMFVSQEEDDDRVWYVTMCERRDSNDNLKQVAVDARTAHALGDPPLDSGFMWVMRSLHIDLFAGLPGMLFLGLMGVLLLVAIVSGTVLYAPFMRKLRFGDVRRDRSPRVKWLDLHNLLGIVTLVWFTVVGATGVINAWSDLLVKYWQATEVAQMVAPYAGQPPLERPGSLQAAVQAAKAVAPGMKVAFVAFPGTSFASPHHYGVFLRGTDAVSSKLLKPVLVDAMTGQVTDSRELPWYLTALLISQPLHFGDYGGRPMQILWAVLDVITIVVLASGLYLWVVRRRQARVADGKLSMQADGAAS